MKERGTLHLMSIEEHNKVIKERDNLQVRVHSLEKECNKLEQDLNEYEVRVDTLEAERWADPGPY